MKLGYSKMQNHLQFVDKFISDILQTRFFRFNFSKTYFYNIFRSLKGLHVMTFAYLPIILTETLQIDDLLMVYTYTMVL